MYGIFWKEQPADVIEKGVALAAKRTATCHTVRVINAYEYDELNKLVYSHAVYNVHG